MEDPQNQAQFYDLFLNSMFYIPVFQPQEQETPDGEEPQTMPLVIEADGNDYLALFDSEERLFAWAETEAEYVKVPGHIVALMSTPELHWALNVGCEPSKEFVPDEIAWLKDVVERFNADEEKGAEEDQAH